MGITVDAIKLKAGISSRTDRLYCFGHSGLRGGDKLARKPREVCRLNANYADRDITVDCMDWLFHLLSKNPRIDAELFAEALVKLT